MKKIVLLFSMLMGTISVGFAASLEGYWKTIDDGTGQAVSLLEIKKQPDGKYTGVIIYRYPVPNGVALTHCSVKCPAPYSNKPLIGLQVVSEFIQNPKKPDEYINGKVMEAKSGKVYKGKGTVSADGRRVKLRGYIGISLLGRNQVWIRVVDPNAEMEKDKQR